MNATRRALSTITNLILCNTIFSGFKSRAKWGPTALSEIFEFSGRNLVDDIGFFKIF